MVSHLRSIDRSPWRLANKLFLSVNVIDVYEQGFSIDLAKQQKFCLKGITRGCWIIEKTPPRSFALLVIALQISQRVTKLVERCNSFETIDRYVIDKSNFRWCECHENPTWLTSFTSIESYCFLNHCNERYARSSDSNFPWISTGQTTFNFSRVHSVFFLHISVIPSAESVDRIIKESLDKRSPFIQKKNLEIKPYHQRNLCSGSLNLSKPFLFTEKRKVSGLNVLRIKTRIPSHQYKFHRPLTILLQILPVALSSSGRKKRSLIIVPETATKLWLCRWKKRSFVSIQGCTLGHRIN